MIPLHDGTWEPLANLTQARDVLWDYLWQHHLSVPGFEGEATSPREPLLPGKGNRASMRGKTKLTRG